MGIDMKNLRIYGTKPFNITVLHGGPGAGGEMAPVARELSSVRGVLEPLQTVTSLGGQVQELHTVLNENGDLPVTLIGWSWGAWLGFIFAAQYHSFVTKLILIGSGPYEEKYAVNIMKTRLSRFSEEDRAEALLLIGTLEDPAIGGEDTLMARFEKLISKADSYDPLPYDSEVLQCHYDIYRNVWNEASELRSNGELWSLARKSNVQLLRFMGATIPILPKESKSLFLAF